MDSNQKVDKNTFIKHMFEDDNVKPSIFNIIQYAATGVIPLIILNKFMQHLHTILINFNIFFITYTSLFVYYALLTL